LALGYASSSSSCGGHDSGVSGLTRSEWGGGGGGDVFPFFAGSEDCVETWWRERWLLCRGSTYTSALQWPCVYLGMYYFHSGGLVASLDPQLVSRFGLFWLGSLGLCGIGLDRGGGIIIS